MKLTLRIWQRSSKLKQYALKRANGFCEGCENKAPFITFEGRAYLEVHHITKISDGGLEDPRKVAAICPNCHRRAHYSRDREKFKMQLLEKIEIKENNLVK